MLAHDFLSRLQIGIISSIVIKNGTTGVLCQKAATRDNEGSKGLGHMSSTNLEQVGREADTSSEDTNQSFK